VDAGSLGLAGGAAFAAAAVNAVVGGGSLITFPALVALGLPAIDASLTNTVGLCPGYLGAALAQRRDLVGQRGRIARVLPVAAVGGVAGALLLLVTGPRAFDYVVPFLILLAALLLAGQDLLRRWLAGRARAGISESWAILPVGLAAIYGGYFGAGMGVMILASLGLVLADSFTRINALKQLVSLAVNAAAAVVFVVSGRVAWSLASAMLVGALAGGVLGGAVASRIPARVLRWVVVVFALGLSGVYFARLW
jgi:uncharacterized protein